MSMERMKFSDLDADSSRSTMASEKRSGCYVSTAIGFVLLLLAIAIAVGIALIVFFAVRDNNALKNKNNTCVVSNGFSNIAANTDASKPNQVPTSQLDALWTDCLLLSKAKNECLSAPYCMASSNGTDGATDTDDTKKPSLPKDVRLPLDLNPTLYEVELQPDIYRQDPEDFVFDGTVVVTLDVVNSTSVIILHINKLTIDNSSIRVEDSSSYSQPWSHWEEDKPRQFFKLFMRQPLEAGSTYRLWLGFSGKLADDLAGMYRSTYKDQGVTKHMVTSQMQPTDARKTFPCMDEPGIKSRFRITILRKQPMKALSNMPLESSEPRANGWIADRFETTVKMPTYLIAIIVCDFRFREATTNRGTRFRVYARPEAIDTVDYSLDIGVRMLQFFEDYFDINYPLPKQDMIAIPDFAAGAMENWGLITYRETALLYDPAVSSASNKQRVAIVVSHELSHQWFGNLVSPEWWDDLWLNEGFATYLEYLGVDFVEPGFRLLDQFVIKDVQSAFRSDGLATSHPLFAPVDHPDQINEIFDSISYAKGGSILRMMNQFLGESTFTTGLTNYLNAHSYGNARNADLWDYLGAQARTDGLTEINVTRAMDTWVKQMGYPVVTFRRNPTRRDRARVTQRHFLTDPTTTPSNKYPSPYSYKWVIPLTFTTNVNSEWNNPEIHWMDLSDLEVTSIPSSADWVVANVGQYGYYRVNYDLENWDRLISQLNSNHQVIPVKNRAQIIDDAFNLGKSGDLTPMYGLRTTQYLSAERDYIPWRAATANLAFFGGMLSKSPTFGLYKRYLLNLIIPSYNRLGWVIQSSDPHLDKFMRSTILSWSCSLSHQPCLDEASRLFRQWMNNPSNNPISPDLKSTVYCYAVENGDEAEWDFTFQQYTEANVASEKSKLLTALSCTKVPWLLNRFLTKATNASEIRKADAPYVIRDIATSTLGGYMAWDFFRGNWDFIKETWGSGFFGIGAMVKGIAGSFNTELELQQVQEFMDKHPDLGAANRSFHQSVESIKTNIKWMKDNQQDIHDWLQTVVNA